MSNNDYSIAMNTLKQAGDAISDRSTKHGDTQKSFEMIGQMWQTYLIHAWTSRKSNTITPQDVAQMMVMVKQARALYGHSDDNFIDAAGFSSLAAMLDPFNQMDKEVGDAINSFNGSEKHGAIQHDRRSRGS